MTDEVNCSDACRRVAEWLGEVERIYPSDLGDHHMILSKSTNADGMYEQWPDYTRDDAAAWRLAMALPAQVSFCEGELVDVIESGDCREAAYIYGEEGCPRKALVLAACKLIDMGVESREVAR